MSEDMTRAEHLTWCKERALVYVQQGDLAHAVASMTSDLQKHPETVKTPNEVLALGMMEVPNGAAAVRRWIEGFA